MIVELHFQNSRHRQSHVNLFYCLQGVLNLILHCYCDIVMKNLFFFVTTIVIIMDLPTLRDFLQLPSWYILYDEDELCLMSVREEADFHYHNQCLLDYFFGLFSNVLWLVVLFQGGISFNPRVLYTVPATL